MKKPRTPSSAKGPAWNRNPRVTVFAKDYFSWPDRERVPVGERALWELVVAGIQRGGVLDDDDPAVLRLSDAAKKACLKPAGDGRVRVRWPLDLVVLCRDSKRYSKSRAQNRSKPATEKSATSEPPPEDEPE